MQSSIKQTKQAIEAIEEVLASEFDQEIEETRTKRLSKEYSKFGGVRE
jgi:hypothetical protein